MRTLAIVAILVTQYNLANAQEGTGPAPQIPKDYDGTVIVDPGPIIEDMILPDLSISKAYLVDDRADKEELPPPRKDNVYKAEDKVWIRAVLDNAGVRSTIDGSREYEIVADLRITDESGKVLFEQDGAQKFSGKGKLDIGADTRKVYVNMGLKAPLDPGEYTFDIVFRDLARSKKVQASQQFKIVYE
jgi:hypothetical protein